MGAAEPVIPSLWNHHELDGTEAADMPDSFDDDVVVLLDDSSDDLPETDVKKDKALIKKGKGDTKYEGAVVFDMKRGYYEDPIATLDFASLYPNIIVSYWNRPYIEIRQLLQNEWSSGIMVLHVMLAPQTPFVVSHFFISLSQRTNNLCFSTLVRNVPQFEALEQRAQRSPLDGDIWFVKPSVRRGILPMVLDMILGARKRAKQALEAATDPAVQVSMHYRQLQLKLGANSMYGFTGFAQGSYPSPEECVLTPRRCDAVYGGWRQRDSVRTSRYCRDYAEECRAALWCDSGLRRY